MADHSRLDDLRRRVQQDPSSIAFAQLAEEYRRASQFEEAVDVCRAGLAVHPAYLSARVTLGRALLELHRYDEARQELEQVLKNAPENLAAIRGLAEVHYRCGSLAEALAQYRAALALARNDPDLEQTVNDLSRKIEPKAPVHTDGLSFEQIEAELLVHMPVPPVSTAAPIPTASPATDTTTATASTLPEVTYGAAATESLEMTHGAALTESPALTDDPAATETQEVTHLTAATTMPEETDSAAPGASLEVSHAAGSGEGLEISDAAALAESPELSDAAARAESVQMTDAAAPAESLEVTYAAPVSVDPEQTSAAAPAETPDETRAAAAESPLEPRAAQEIAALEEWLRALHVARAERDA